MKYVLYTSGFSASVFKYISYRQKTNRASCIRVKMAASVACTRSAEYGNAPDQNARVRQITSATSAKVSRPILVNNLDITGELFISYETW